MPLAKAGRAAAGRRTSSSTRSPASRAPARAPTERTHFSEIHGSVAAYGVLGHRHGAEIEQGWARGHVHAAPGAARSRHPRDDLRARDAGHDRSEVAGALRGRLRATRRSSASPATRCPRSSMSRTRTSATSAGGSTRPGRVVIVSVHRQPGEGRRGPGGAEHERHVRARRTAGTAVTGSARPEVRRRTAREHARSARRWRQPRSAATRATTARRRPRRRQGDRRRR